MKINFYLRVFIFNFQHCTKETYILVSYSNYEYTSKKYRLLLKIVQNHRA